LYAGQSIPDGQRRCGSPATQITTVDYRAAPTTGPSNLKKAVYCLATSLPGFFTVSIVFSIVPEVVEFLGGRQHFAEPATSALFHWSFYIDALAISIILFFGFMLLSLLIVGTVPRLLNRALSPNKVYPLYGLRYWLHGAIRGMTNLKFFTYLFGDSSYIVHYLQWIGYDLSRVVQTGSNFGMDVKHDNPFLVSIGSGTVVADGLSVINADYSSTSFSLSQASIGADNFVGNFVAYPAQGKTGDNCLLATKVMVPLEGEVRDETGLLGSPSFEIPRTVQRDREIDSDRTNDLTQALRAKDRHNLATMGLFLLAHWFLPLVLLCVAFTAIADLYRFIGFQVLVLAGTFGVVFSMGYYILLERLSTLFRPLQPLQCSIYDPRFWSHERYWKLMVTSDQLAMLNGTPFKGLAWRLLGVRIGKRVFDDGCGMTEKTMVSIGDDCTLNVGCIIQPHSQEDGGFKSDRIAIGAGCTLGIGSWVHYGAKMGDGAQLEPDAFLMKGEEVSEGAIWGENPAREISGGPVSDDNASRNMTPAIAAE